MNLSRRNLLKASATATVSAMAATSSHAQPLAVEIPPLSGQMGLRIANFQPTAQASARLGVVTDMGAVIDIAMQAQKQKVKLNFDPTSMLSFLHAGDQALQQVQKLVSKAQTSGIPVQHVKFLSPIPRPITTAISASQSMAIEKLGS